MSFSAVHVGAVGANVTTFTANNLHAGQTEYFYVQAFNSTSASNSYWQSVTMPAASQTALEVFTAFERAALNAFFSVRWSEPAISGGHLIK